jgi:hypothetical protein
LRRGRSAATLDAGANAWDWRTSAGAARAMEAIYAILIFIAVIAVLNRLEFGRFD